MIKLITTDSYFNLFGALNASLKGKVNLLDGKNLIFCEEKVSLMAERSILAEYGGSFNTAVYSFGNYLRLKMPAGNTLTKEGSAMAVKRVLSSVPLSCFRASSAGLAPSLYELIIQLKSAKVKPSDLAFALENTTGALKNKLADIYAVYAGYEDFIAQNKLDDQSSMLNYLPELIQGDAELGCADVYIVGFNGWTSQIRSAISALINKAKSVTAILTEGENEMVFVNETANAFRELVKAQGKALVEQRLVSEWTKEGKLIADSLFNPISKKTQKTITDKIFTFQAENRSREVERVGKIIRQKVSSGECRYKDITLALGDTEGYSDDIERVFSQLKIPYFVDQKKRVGAHPLVRLILSYIDAFRKNLEKGELSAFYKNPLFCADKALSDEFENYILAYNIDYSRLKKPFTFAPKGNKSLEELNEFRERIVKHFDKLDIYGLLNELGVQEKLNEFSGSLRALGEIEESAVNEQIYSAVTRVLGEMNAMLYGMDISVIEYRNIFVSGISAMELSIIPQYNDAVFIGGLKETALAKAKHLFVLGLTADIPAVKEDVALLSDGDISLLEEIKVLIEPKIKVVNHRERENAALALSAFADSLYLSYPILNVAGDKTVKSQALSEIEELFTVRPFPKVGGYLTYKSGLSAFARACGDFATGKLNDFKEASSFYAVAGENDLKPLLDRANQEIKIRLDGSKEIMAKSHVSPTRIEDYYKCPYRAFLSGGLRLKRREEGVVDGFSVGNLMHEIFSEYALKMQFVTDEISSNELVDSIARKALQKEEYARYLTDAVTSTAVESALKECAKFCYKNYLAMQSSSFKVKKTEVSFNDNAPNGYPAIKLMGGKVKLIGKIDRVDESGEYYRVLDYKTASPSADLDLLFTGKKLQLYLYAKAVNYDENNPKKLAGAYYMPISDKFRKEGEEQPVLSKGVTLSDEVVVGLQDENALSGKSEFLPVKIKGDKAVIDGEMTGEGLNALVDYAVALSEKAVERMSEGVIAPTPCDDRICGYCEFKELCSLAEPAVRKHGGVDATTIIDSVRRDKDA